VLIDMGEEMVVLDAGSVSRLITHCPLVFEMFCNEIDIMFSARGCAKIVKNTFV